MIMQVVNRSINAIKICIKAEQTKQPILKTLKRSFRERRDGFFSTFEFLSYGKFQRDVENCDRIEDYIDMIVKLNQADDCGVLEDKLVLYQRCPEMMSRKLLDLLDSDTEEIVSFVREHKKFVGKHNWSCASEGFHMYENVDKNMISVFEKDKVDLLEGYVEQHPLFNHIYDKSVNTIRIHTIRNSHETRIFLLPKVRIGADGSLVDNCGKSCYRVLLDHDGNVLDSFYITDRIVRAEKHKNSGVVFKDLRFPYIREAEALCIRAAERFPELRYIGWDVAITEKGPILVEGNSNSGAIGVYQAINVLRHGVGIKKEIEDMFLFCREVEPFFAEKTIHCKVTCDSDDEAARSVTALLRNCLHRNNVVLEKKSAEAFVCRVSQQKKEEIVIELFDDKGAKRELTSVQPAKTIYERERQVSEVVDKLLRHMAKKPE